MVNGNKEKKEISNRLLYTLITIGILAVIGVGVYAYGTSNPSLTGHSAGELDLSGGVNGNAVFNGNVSALGLLTNTKTLNSTSVVSKNFFGDGSGLTNLVVRVSGAGTCNSSSDGLLRYRSSFCSADDVRSSSFDICMKQSNSLYNWSNIKTYTWADVSCNLNGCPPGQDYYECSNPEVPSGCYSFDPPRCWCPEGSTYIICPF